MTETKNQTKRKRWWRIDPRIIDARGELRAMHEWVGGVLPTDPIRRNAMMQVQAIFKEAFRRVPVILGVFFGLIPLVYFGLFPLAKALFGTQLWQLRAILWVSLAVVVVGFGLWFRVFFARVLRSQSHALQQVVNQSGVCICCGYDLFGLPRAQDGCRECPECGAAWVSDGADARGPLCVEKEKDAIGEYAAGWRSVAATVFISLFRIRSVGKIKDDRGARVPIVGPDYEGEVDRATGEKAAVKSRLIRRCIRPVGRASRVIGALMFVILALVGVAGVFAWVRWRLPVPFSFVPGVMGGLIVVGAFPFLIFKGNFGYNSRRVRDRILRIGLCPACAEDISLSEVESDGCISCPSCAAAWRADRIEKASDSKGSTPT